MAEFRAMRRNKQELAHDECVRILEKATAGVLSLIGDGGYPYGVPLSHVYKDGSLFFHSALTGHKIDAIRAEEKCSFTVIEKDEVHPDEYTTYFRSVIAFGKIHIIEDEEQRLGALRSLGEKFNPGDHEGIEKEIGKHLTPDNRLQHVLILRMDIDHLSGKEAIELVRARKP